MAEILDFPERGRKPTTALGRFLFASWDQQDELERQAAINRALKARRPSEREIERASRELRFIFSGDNEKEADELYRKGASDISHRRNDTAAAAFYTHVSGLQSVAYLEYDRLPQPIEDESQAIP